MKLVFDIETNPIDFTKGDWLEHVHTIHCISIQDVDSNKIGTYYDARPRQLGDLTVRAGIERLKEADELIGHNIIQFDLPVLEKLCAFTHTRALTDTLVLSRLLYPDRSGGHSLKEWGERLGYSKGDFNEFEEYSEDMREYCERDVSLNRRVYELLRQEHEDWGGHSLQTEHHFARIIASQEATGFLFDIHAAVQLIKDWDNELDTIDGYIHSRLGKRIESGTMVKTPFKINGKLSKHTLVCCDKFNIDPNSIAGPFVPIHYVTPNLESKSQQKKILLELGWLPEKTTPTGGPKLDDSIKKVGPIGERISQRNVISHRRSLAVGLVNLVDSHGRVHGGGNPCGTPTGRMRHSRIVNIPRMTSRYGKELRSLFTVPDTKVLVGYDAAALELRILAHYIGDKDYVDRVTTRDRNRDAHTLAARAAGSTDRELGKTINYALIYGAGDRKLGSIIGGGEEEGRAIREALYKAIPGFEVLVNRVKQAGSKGYLISLDKRRLYCRPRVSPLNTLIQGGGAIYMKTVACVLDDLSKGLQAFKVIDMHDEAQWECPIDECDALDSAIHKAFKIVTATLELRCPQEPEIKRGKTWADTH